MSEILSAGEVTSLQETHASPSVVGALAASHEELRRQRDEAISLVSDYSSMLATEENEVRVLTTERDAALAKAEAVATILRKLVERDEALGWQSSELDEANTALSETAK